MIMMSPTNNLDFIWLEVQMASEAASTREGGPANANNNTATSELQELHFTLLSRRPAQQLGRRALHT
jgi:hypothetical protein